MKHILIHFAALTLLMSSFAHARSPFDDLSAEEIKETVGIVRGSGKFAADVRFPVLRRQDPKKADWLQGKAKDTRLSYAAVFDFKKSMMTEVVVDLNSKKIISMKDLPGIKPPVLLEEYDRARAIVRADAGWQKAMKDRGISNLDDVFIDIWGPGLMSAEEQKPGKRILRALSYHRGTARNVYSRPIEGYIVNVDLSAGKISSVWDVEKTPIAPGHRELGEKDNKPVIEPLKKLTASQPDGPSFRIDGQEISWERWKFRYSIDPLQGLQLYHVRFNDAGKERSIIYKISLAEMLVPYGSPEKTWSFRNAFDVGEYGLGKTLHPLVVGKDVPANGVLLDSVLGDDLGGDPLVIKGASAIYERDGGILWKHRNAENGDTDIRRARQLVITFMTTIGNYDYGINYIFNQDGTIKVDTQLTGILLAKGTNLSVNPCTSGCKPLVEKNVLAPPHQHFFNFRIDFDIDGADRNSAAEMNVKAVKKGPENPDGNMFISENTMFKKEKDGIRDLNPPSARKWKVVNNTVKNAMGHPTGYALMPEEAAFAYMDKNSQIRKRAEFISHPMWFTKYKDDEMSGGAAYPTTAPMGQGLPKYVADNENIDNGDVVMWYTFGVTHIPRPEEWPIMSTHHTGFALMPVNFFSENPAMKVGE